MRTLHRTSLSFVRLIPTEIEASSFGDDEQEKGSYKLQSSLDLPAGMGCPLVADRPAAHIGTIVIPRTTFHIHPGSKLDPKVPFLRHFGSVIRASAKPRSPEASFTRYLPVPRHDHKSSDPGNVVPLRTELGARS